MQDVKQKAAVEWIANDRGLANVSLPNHWFERSAITSLRNLARLIDSPVFGSPGDAALLLDVLIGSLCVGGLFIYPLLQCSISSAALGNPSRFV